jgi:transcription initiation factor TFIID subunit 5
LQIIDSRTWKNVRTLKDPEFKNPSSINWSQFAISPDGVYTVCGSESGALIVWEIESGKRNRYLKGHLNAVTCCSWSSNGTNIVSADKEGILNVWS